MIGVAFERRARMLEERMTPKEFVAQFRALHEKAKSGKLTPAERVQYGSGRTQFIRFVVVAQELGQTGKTLRSNLRMAKLLKVELKPDGGDVLRLSTMDLASGGFAALVQGGMKIGHPATFTLFLPASGGAPNPIQGRCTVASSRPQTGLFRVSFRFEGLAPEAQEKLDVALIDAVLERFSG